LDRGWVSPKFELDDPAPNFVVPRPVKLTVALYSVNFLEHFDGRAVNIVTLYELKEREKISATVRILSYIQIFQKGSGTHPGSRLTRSGASFSGSKSTGGLKPIDYVHAM
jgi:hypothetical protein